VGKDNPVTVLPGSWRAMVRMFTSGSMTTALNSASTT
jgi:hypothetical protein